MNEENKRSQSYIDDTKAFFNDLDIETDRVLDKITSIYKYGLKSIISNDILEKFFTELVSTDSDLALEYLKSVSNYQKPLKVIKEDKLWISFKKNISTTTKECPLCVDKRLRRSDCPAFSIDLEGTPYLLKCSPSMYIPNHFVLSHYDHLPIRNDENEICHMLNFTDIFPSSVVASNNGLERIGGSLPNHIHFQVIKEHFPLMNAKRKKILSKDDLICSSLEWKIPSLVLTSSNKDTIVSAYSHIFKTYLSYEYEGIINNDKKGHNNGVNILVNKDGDTYQLFIIFRSKYKKDGKYLFDTSHKRYAIKQSGIGVFESAGLFVLDEVAYDEYLSIKSHNSIPKAYRGINKRKLSVEAYLENECLKIVTDVSIIKDKKGRQAFLKDLVFKSLS